jgi:hypothetical protein
MSVRHLRETKNSIAIVGCLHSRCTQLGLLPRPRRNRHLPAAKSLHGHEVHLRRREQRAASGATFALSWHDTKSVMNQVPKLEDVLLAVGCKAIADMGLGKETLARARLHIECIPLPFERPDSPGFLEKTKFQDRVATYPPACFGATLRLLYPYDTQLEPLQYSFAFSIPAP